MLEILGLGLLISTMTISPITNLSPCQGDDCSNPIGSSQQGHGETVKPARVGAQWTGGSWSLDQSTKGHHGGDDSGRPPQRKSGGSRNPCQELVIALVPGEGEIREGGTCATESRSLLAFTSSEQPMVWVYIPEQSQSDLKAELALVNPQQYLIYRQTVTLDETPGVVGIALSKPLEPGQVYRWIFSLQHHVHNQSRNPTVEGLLQWRSLDSHVIHQLEATELLKDKVAIYGEHDFWYDALELVAEQRCRGIMGGVRPGQTDNGQAESQWFDLLQSLGIKGFAKVPIINCNSFISGFD